MGSTGRSSRSYQDNDSSDNTPIFKKSRMRETKQQDPGSGSDEKYTIDLEAPATSTPTTMALPLPSKRTEKRAKVLAKTGDIGSNDKAKGLVRIQDGQLQHFLNSLKKWIPAMYHNDIREELIAESEALGDYDHPRARGLGEHDVTSFLPVQKTWGIERQYWPDVLFQIVPDKGTRSAADKVKPWYRDGKILLDQDNNPINGFVNIPATLSTEFEGQYMEAMCRLDSRIKQADFRARMPNMMVVKADKPAVPLFTLNTISMRMSRFRDQAALISREKRAGSKTLEENLRQLLPNSCFEENSTRSLGRLLTPKEVALVKSVNKGKFGYRVRTKGEEAAGFSGTAGAPRKRTRAKIEDDNDEQDSEIHTTTPELPRVKRSRHAQVQEPDWSSVIDPTLYMLAPRVPNLDIQNHHFQAQASTSPWSPANDDYFLESDNAYSTNPGHEFALSISNDNTRHTSALTSIGSNQGFPQCEMLTNRGCSTTGEYGTPFVNTSTMKQSAVQNQHGDAGRLAHRLHCRSQNHVAARSQSVSECQPDFTADDRTPHNINLAADTVITAPSANISEDTGSWDKTSNVGWGLPDQSIFAESIPAPYEYPIFDETIHSNGSGQHEPKESLDAADRALKNDLLHELGRGDANGVIPGEEQLATGAFPNFSFSDYLNQPDSENEDSEYVTIEGR